MPFWMILNIDHHDNQLNGSKIEFKSRIMISQDEMFCFRKKRILFTDKTKGTVEMYEILSGTRTVLYSSLDQPSQLSYSANTG
jgi:hypothetical protein